MLAWSALKLVLSWVTGFGRKFLDIGLSLKKKKSRRILGSNELLLNPNICWRVALPFSLHFPLQQLAGTPGPSTQCTQSEIPDLAPSSRVHILPYLQLLIEPPEKVTDYLRDACWKVLLSTERKCAFLMLPAIVPGFKNPRKDQHSHFSHTHTSILRLTML